jgi:putative membrane-bound dehydrogenase-like protein
MDDSRWLRKNFCNATALKNVVRDFRCRAILRIMAPAKRFVFKIWLCVTICGVFAPPLEAGPAAVTQANRLVYLDENDPFYPRLEMAKLATPQWVGEAGVEGVVILAIDDMQSPQRYAAFLGPVLDRLKKIDGRAPISIFCVGIKPDDPQYQQWLAEGLSLESHTLTHPCPILGQTNFEGAEQTFFGSISNVNAVPGNHAVAFRTPCCDSMNSPSPRLFAEFFNRTTAQGQFLTIDSSIMDVLTKNDSSLPASLVTDAGGADKFQKYIPSTNFQTTIENYPYPFVIGRLCWELPPAAPSDWEAFHFHGATNSLTVEDWKAGLDATVSKQGVFTMIFHPHGWIRSEQLVELIDHAVKAHGTKIKFLNFREAQERLDANLLDGQPLRAADGGDNGVRLLDLNNDGFMDVVIGNDRVQKTRVWSPGAKKWIETSFPVKLVSTDGAGRRHDLGVRFGVMTTNGNAAIIVRNESVAGAWIFDGAQWVEKPALLNGLELNGEPVYTSRGNRDRGVRLRDVEHKGVCNLIVGNESQNTVFSWSEAEQRWKQLDFALPPGASIVDSEGNDAGLRFADINGDGFDDVIFSNAKRFSSHLFTPEPVLGFTRGWTRELSSGARGEPGSIPMIVRDGLRPNNGVWFKSESLWVQNEDTGKLPDQVERHTFKELMAGAVAMPKSPQDSLACISVSPGFKVELVASEPLTKSPIAFDWGADGKFWIVEMGDYPLGVDGHGKPGGIVRFLEDTKGDGHYDKSTVFLDNLPFPTGIIPWRKGVIVCDPPEIFYAEDTNGDGIADTHVTLFKGFIEGNQQHRANGFDYGLDNWLYGANGDSSGTITSVITGHSVNINGRDFRFRPDSGLFETQPGQAQYGRHRDDWGNWFGVDNPSPPWHYFLPEEYLSRNPFLRVRRNKQVVAQYDDATRVYPTSRLAERFNDPDAANHLTSANSPVPYRDDLFGPDFANAIFVSEPVHNLVHRENLEPAGVSFLSHRAATETNSEFFASSDNWTRPTMTKTGPDGALYIADMYRLVIEHPEWIPEDIQKSVDLRAGADKGRIYRVYPANASLRPIPRLDKLDAQQLAEAMESPNGWQRDTAQRLLVASGDKAAVPPLEKLAFASPHPKVRLQALCALDGLNALTTNAIHHALGDPDFHVREHAVRLAPALLNTAPDIGPALLPLANDPEICVRFQLAFSLGTWGDTRVGRALVQIAMANPDDERVRTAVMCSAPGHLAQMLTAILGMRPIGPEQGNLLADLVGLAASLRDPTALAHLSTVLHPNNGNYESWQFMAMRGLIDGLERNNMTLEKFRDKSGPEIKNTSTIDDLFVAARQCATNSEKLEDKQVAAIALLGRGLNQQESDIDALSALLSPQNSQAVQDAALKALERLRGHRAGTALVAGWRNSGPSAQPRILDALISRKEWIGDLLDAIEAGKIGAGAIAPQQQQTLLEHGSADMRERAEKLFTSSNADRRSVVKRYEETKLSGDALRGRALFRQNCIPCHRLENEGNAIGPDLGSVSFKPSDYLTTAILDPNQSVEARYISYNVVTKTDQEYTGVVAAETANSITLRVAGGAEITVLRSDLRQFSSTGRSLMPDGFEKTLDPQALADVIAYIHTGGAVKK